MIFSENRLPLFRIMLKSTIGKSRRWAIEFDRVAI
jgi:hypothetical protein